MCFLWKLLAEKQLALQYFKDLEKKEKFQQNKREKVSNRKTAVNKNKEFAVRRDIISKEVEKILASQK
ncbi:hypothetical protein ATZ36_01060 [Candidatus Endomicrobiellum trichonymphae]|uniref:Uncharacterized protein n=1 Tax=Endomicrobium trichonymphae TaxID=1408204 RepID=A0A1E5IJ31_ENDTX|nr:hypothetical protein ATZ36_01060 [Candidatus Endomicrobium trichonymphae]